jgi:transposase
MSAQKHSPLWLGIDLSQRSMDVCAAPEGVEPAQWRNLAVKHIPHAPGSSEAMACLARWMKEHHPRARWAGVCVEATGRLADQLAEALAAAKLRLPLVTTVNPARPKSFAKSLGARDKTDKVDAAILAVFAATHRPEPQPPRSENHVRLEAINRHREALVNDRTAWINRKNAARDPFVKKSIQTTIDSLDEQIKHCEHEAKAIVHSDPAMSEQCQIIEGIYCMGTVSAFTLTAELGRLDEYARTQLSGAVNTYPIHFESGHSVHKRPHMAKGGGQRVRRVLYMCALAIMRRPKHWRKFIERLQKAGKTTKVIIGAIMRKLLLVARAAVKEGRFIASKIGKKQNPKNKLTPKYA